MTGAFGPRLRWLLGLVLGGVLIGTLKLCEHGHELFLRVLGLLGDGLLLLFGLGRYVGEELDHDGECAGEVQDTVYSSLVTVQVHLALR